MFNSKNLKKLISQLKNSMESKNWELHWKFRNLFPLKIEKLKKKIFTSNNFLQNGLKKKSNNLLKKNSFQLERLKVKVSMIRKSMDRKNFSLLLLMKIKLAPRKH